MATHPDKPPLLRTLLILGRVSNVPTVWSNCLAGWLLAGGGAWSRFAVLCGGASLLYIGGMFLNDACDVRFDTAHRKERPIPSGTISARAVWLLSTVLLLGGGVLLASLGPMTALVTLGLGLCIVAYDLVHKLTALAPLLMAGCRFLLYLVAGSAALDGISAKLLWCAGALAAYIVGLSFIARNESGSKSALIRWPMAFLLAPMLATLVQPDVPPSRFAPLLCLPLLAWVGWSLYPLLAGADGARLCRRDQPQQPGTSGSHGFFQRLWQCVTAAAGRGRHSRAPAQCTVSALLAGIVLVDMLAVQGGGGLMPLAFLSLFVSALILQRTIPAT